jgi:hypothetical protein
LTRQTRTIVTTSWDDGHPLDLRLADLLADCGVPATFYVAPRNCERPVLPASDIRRLGERFEIGAHGLTHRILTRLDDRNLEREVFEGRRWLEDLLGRPVDTFCYPKGRHDVRVRRAVVRCGYVGARTTQVLHLDLPQDPWLVWTTLGAKRRSLRKWCGHWLKRPDCPFFRDFVLAGFGRSWARLACRLFERALREGGVWHLWGHSWEIEELGLWADLREVLRTVAGRDDVAYLPNSEVMRMAAASRHPE